MIKDDTNFVVLVMEQFHMSSLTYKAWTEVYTKI